MKKFLTFSNFMVLLGIMTIFFYFIPAVKISVNGFPSYNTTVNLFTATFGGNYVIKVVEPIPHPALQANGGLIVAFIFSLLAIIFTCLRFKSKFATLLAFPFYLTSGILVACTGALVTYVNNGNFNMFHYSMQGGAIAVCVFFFILAFFALAEFVLTIARPKVQQQPEAY